jgi:hypothetical protein
MKFSEAGEYLEKGLAIRHGSFSFVRPGSDTTELKLLSGGLIGSLKLLNNFFDNEWEVEKEPGKWEK